MDRLKVFISYSSKQKLLGGKFKLSLENYCGYKVFVAHDDIPGAAVWEEEIMQGISDADFFIPLISREFRMSPFTDQEIGIAVFLKKKIIPIKLEDLNPYGFIQKYQAIPYREFSDVSHHKDDISKLALIIAQLELNKPSSTYYQKATSSMVYAFCTSTSFDVSNATIQLLCNCDDLSSDQISHIRQAILNNSQIRGAYGLPALKDCLNKKYKVTVD